MCDSVLMLAIVAMAARWQKMQCAEPIPVGVCICEPC